MSSADSLILDLLDWLGPAGRSYADVMAAWRTSCPRLPGWEDANELGFLRQNSETGLVSVAENGAAHLRRNRNSTR